MADISEFNINNTLYNLKDTQARNDIQSISSNLNNYLPLTGGTLTGSLTTSLQLTIKDNTIDTLITPESNLWPKHLTIKDKDNIDRGYFELYQNTSNVQGIQLETKRIINNTNIYNGIRLGIDSTGNKIINLDGAESWRTALGAINDAWPIELGGTGATTAANALTNLGAAAANHTHSYLPLSGGTLTANLNLKNSSMDVTAATLSSTVYRDIIIKDKNDENIGYLQFGQAANDGRTVVKLATKHKLSNSTAILENHLTLRQYNNGNRTVELADPKAWRNALEAVNGIWPTDIGGTGGTDSGWETISMSTTNFTGSVYYRAIGKFVELVADPIKTKAAVNSSDPLIIGSIPSGYKPSTDFTTPVNSAATGGMITIKTDGILRLYRNSAIGTIAISSNIYFHCMYTIT